MPPIPSPDQVMPRVLAGEHLAPPATPPAKNSPEAMAADMTRKIQETGWRSALEIGANPPVDEQAVLQKRDEIGFTRDPVDGHKTRPNVIPAGGTALDTEGGRYAAVQTADDLALRYERYGFESTAVAGGLTTADQTTIRNAVKALVTGNPTWNKAYTLPGVNQDAFIDGIIRDPSYAGRVRQALVEYSGMQPLPNTAETAWDAVQEAERVRTLKGAEVTRIGNEISANQGQLDRFDRSAGATAGTYAGADAEEIRDVEANMPRLRAEIARFSQQQASHNASADILREELTKARRPTIAGARVGTRSVADIRSDLSDAESAAVKAAGEAARRQARIDNVVTLKQREIDLRAEKQRLTPLLATAQTELKAAEDALRTANGTYVDARDTRIRLEKARVAKIQGIFTEAATGVMNSRSSEASTLFQTAVETFKTEAQDGYQRSVFDCLDGRYIDPAAAARGRTVLNLGAINGDLRILLGPNGQEQYVRALLVSSINPDTGHPYTPAEANARIADKDFMAAVKDKATTLLLAKADARKGGLTPAEQSIIFHSSWGQQLIVDAYKANDDFRTFVDSHGNRDALNNPNFLSRLRREWGHKSLFWLLLLGLPLLSAAKSAASNPSPYT